MKASEARAMAEKYNSVEEEAARTNEYRAALFAQCLEDIQRAAQHGRFSTELCRLHSMLQPLGEATEKHLASKLEALGYKVQFSGWFKSFSASW